ncbi:LysR family transcriptional regulator [Rhizobium leguminosarum]|uniref:LysR family transcriptional regulator n=1 Tax=Rhizobium leguminosarum TaxID=384 RepID=A0A4Q1UCP3_RHILE|nr:LysR family transcriptional regulator [Rhizobium leguminosarum]RXT29822.1 LysR family transcriptional regulator [Rhizobium leguminosarum]
MDRMDALRLYIAVAETESFSGVARQRAIATSTVALAVTQLEQEFGARLMTRTTRRLVFTHEGERLLVDARRILADWDAAMSGMMENGPLTGPIKVTATNDFGRSQLRTHLDAFQVLHPQITMSLVLTDSTIDLVEERIDLALRYGPLADSSLRARLLVRGHRLVCASPDYWHRAGKPRHPGDLSDHNCLILSRPGAPLAAWPFRDGDRQFTVKVSGDRQASDGAILREWGVEGVGVVLKNDWDIRNELQTGKLETALDAYVAGHVDLYAVQPAGPPSRRTAALVAYLSTAIAQASVR